MSVTFAPDILSGKNAFVAGGTGGINLGIAKALAALGADVAVLSRSQEKVNAATAEIEALGVRSLGVAADVRDFDAVSDAIRTFAATLGKLDIVVSGAAGNFPSPAEELSANGFKAVVDVDLVGTFNVLRASYEHLRKPGASIINISAPQGSQPYPAQAHVCAAKSGVDMLTKTLALEWGPAGVRVNAIAPGPIEGTEGMARLTPTEESRRQVEQTIPLRRYGRIDEIADLAVFLCSDAAQYLTGAVIPCDGGLAVAGPPQYQTIPAHS
jgi:NAD(P)-dependent dehydrogenase (short-subunit alcohol dehydrogenase family)